MKVLTLALVLMASLSVSAAQPWSNHGDPDDIIHCPHTADPVPRWVCDAFTGD